MELHPGLDELREQILLEDDAGRPFVLRVDAPLAPASQRLMDFLGVTVEVRKVTPTAAQLALERGSAAFDYRASRARVVRRIETGETPQVCSGCGTEVDVDEPSHSPRCRYFAVAPLVEVKSETTHTKTGALSAAEMQRRHQDHLDGRPSTTRCAFDGCSFVFEGTLAECRDAFEQHRREEHPSVKTSRGAAGRERERVQAEAELRAQQRALRALDDGEPPRELADRTSDIPASDEVEEPEDRPAEAKRRWRRWDREQAIARLQEVVAVLGHVPASTTVAEHELPGAGTLIRLFGNWSDYVEAAGYPRPTRGRHAATHTTEDSSDERAVDPTAEEGPRSPTPPVGRADEQQPALGARSQAAAADGSGAAGDAQPAADPEPGEAPPASINDNDAANLSAVLRALADALDAGLFRRANLALIFDGLALEIRDRIEQAAA